MNGSHLSLSFGTFLELRHLLALHRGGGNFLSKDNITDFTRGQGGNINAVTLPEILSEDQPAKDRCTKKTHAANMRSFIATSTLIHSSSVREGQTKWGSVIVDLSG